MPSNLGLRISEAMARRDMSKLYAVAVALNVTEGAVSRWRSGGKINLENTIALCELLDISSDWLLMGRGTMDMHRISQPVLGEQGSANLGKFLAAINWSS